MIHEQGRPSGDTPLHFAVQYSSVDCLKQDFQRCPPEEMCQALVITARQPTALHKCLQNKGFWLPQTEADNHFGAVNPQSWTVAPPSDSYEKIQLLVEACPESQLIQDDKGRLPVQLARMEKLPFTVRRILVMATPTFDVETFETVTNTEDYPVVQRRSIFGRTTEGTSPSAAASELDYLSTSLVYLFKFASDWATVGVTSEEDADAP